MAKLTPFQDRALNYSNHISVTANAGSGKTFVLSKRYLSILLNEDVAIKNIVAITFTEKAASELYRKISNEIEDKISASSDSSEVRRLELLRRQLVSANISTIHSFCINILKEFSPEAGIDAAFSPIDQVTSNELIDLSIEELFSSLVNPNEFTEVLKDVIRVFGSKSAVISILKQLINERKTVDEISERIYNKEDREVAKYLLEVFNKDFENIFGDEITKVLIDIKTINNLVLQNKPDNDSAIAIDSLLIKFDQNSLALEKIELLKVIADSLLTKSGSVKAQGYLGKKAREGYHTIIEDIESFFNSISSFHFDGDIDKVNKLLVELSQNVLQLYDFVLDVYEEKKYSKSYLDFEDILLSTEKIIAIPQVQASLSEKYKYIMIDEFQDTNELQYKIFMPILKYLDVGNLFIVGDQKQSIYRFRGAEPEIFNKTVDEIRSKAGNAASIELPHSFRVAPIIAAFVNVLFTELFKSPNRFFNEVEYNPLVCARPESDDGSIKFIITGKEENDLEERELISREIINLNQSGTSFGDIAILCRKRKQFSELEEVFSKYNIPFIISGGKGFYQRQIIADLYNYISFLLNQNEDGAFVGALRSPFYSLSDLEIYKISLESGNSFYDKFKAFFKKNEDSEKIVEQIENHSLMAAKVEFPTLIRNLLLQTNYWSVVASRNDAEQELANLEKIIVIASTFANQGFKSLFDFKEYLKEAIYNFSDEGQAINNTDENCVKIMTVHQSKGLEFDTLFLYRCNDRSIDDRVKRGDVAIDKRYGILSKVYDDDTYFNQPVTPPITALHNFVIQKKDSAEIKRLFYVAITRAVNHLYISGTVKDNKYERGSFLELVHQGLHTSFENEYTRSYEQPFMKDADSNFEVYPNIVDINIQIIRELDEQQELEKIFQNKFSELKRFINKVDDIEKEEIVSATKVATFSQCPVKYQLTYELGFAKFQNLLDNKIHLYAKDYRTESDEGSELAGDLRGRIIHAILEKEIPSEGINEAVEELLSSENYQSGKIIGITEAVTNDIKSFYDSEIYKEIQTFNNYYNEFEIYTKYKDYYLFGIVDKLIIDNDKLIIVDYKSDQIDKDEIAERAENYIPQLKFYAFALSKYFPNIKKFELRLIFISLNGKYILQSFDKTSIDKYGEYIESIVQSIRENRFSKNLNHCRKCHFFKSKKCVLD